MGGFFLTLAIIFAIIGIVVLIWENRKKIDVVRQLAMEVRETNERARQEELEAPHLVILRKFIAELRGMDALPNLKADALRVDVIKILQDLVSLVTVNIERGKGSDTSIIYDIPNMFDLTDYAIPFIRKMLGDIDIQSKINHDKARENVEVAIGNLEEAYRLINRKLEAMLDNSNLDLTTDLQVMQSTADKA